MEKFNEKGIWSLPGEEHGLVGDLIFDPMNGAELKLMGSFGEKSYPFEFKNYEIILGQIQRKDVTLLGCQEYYRPFSYPGFQETSLKVNTVLMGHHFKKKEDIKLKSISVSFSYLEYWAGKTGIKHLNPFDPDKFGFIFEYPENVEALLDDLKISIKYGFNRSSNPFHVDLKQHTIFEIESERDVPYEELFNKCKQIQNFLSLGVGKPVYPLKIRGKSEIYAQNVDDKTIYPDIEMYYQTNPILLLDKPVQVHEMFFSLENIANNFEGCITNWLTKFDKLRSVYELYFGKLYNPNMFLEHQFLSYIQAIESYHRRMIGGHYLSKESYESVANVLIENIPEKISADHKNSLKSRINYGYEYSLRTRLKDVVNKFEYVIGAVIPNKSNFIHDTVETRNYFTHYDEDGKKTAIIGNELDELTQKLKFIIELCFLEEIGFKQDQISNLVSEDVRYNHIIKSNISKGL